MREHDLQNLARIELSKQGFKVFRVNVGKFKLADGRWFDTGLPKGFSDLLAVRHGRAHFFEIKGDRGRPSAEQLNFIEQMQKIGCVAGVVWSMEDIYRLIWEVDNDVCDIRSTDSEGIDGTVEG
jgi:hypothetical protein